MFQINAVISIHQRKNMISEGQCDTEDWSDDAENSAYNK